MAVPKVKVTFDADLDELKKGVKGATTEVDSFSDKVGDFGKKAGLAFAAAAAAAGAYAGKLAIDGVKAAMEDEKSQTQLALALENVTKATDKQIAAVESQILKMSLATGVADDKLRPAFSRLVRSTEDTEKAQKLLNLALDVSTATGKPLEGVTNALAKAYDGNTASLGKLGVGLSAAELKTMSFDGVTQKLSATFGGAAAANADTYAGKMARVQIAFDEAKETLGYKLLPILDKFFAFVNEKALPALEAFSNGFDLNSKAISDIGTTVKVIFTPIIEGMKKAWDSISDAIGKNMDKFAAFGKLIKETIAPILGNVLGKAFEIVGDSAAMTINLIGKVIGAVTTMVNGAIAAINWLIDKYNSVPILPNIPKIPTGSAPTVTVPTVTTSSSSSSSGSSIPTVDTSAASSAATSAATAAAKASTSNVVTGSFNVGSFRAAEAASMAQPVVNNITVNGAIDPEGTARTIVDVLNTSAARGTLGGLALVGAFDR